MDVRDLSFIYTYIHTYTHAYIPNIHTYVYVVIDTLKVCRVVMCTGINCIHITAAAVALKMNNLQPHSINYVNHKSRY